MRIAPLPLILVALLVTSPASACYWDRDTLSMEKRRFPRVLHVLTGQFVRHSTAYYEWRVADRTARLEAKPDQLDLMDDLAVGLDKLGRHDEAIEVAKKTLALKPGRYESHANLGTLFIHAGKLEDGLVHIKKAIAINPDAHFGREIVQQRLVEYVLERKKEGWTGGPLCGGLKLNPNAHRREPHPRPPRDRCFAKYAKAAGISSDAARKGVVGMMHFGNYRSPVLLDALGDVLTSGSRGGDAKRLAARAFLRAAQLTTNPEHQQLYRGKAWRTLGGHRGVTLDSIGTKLARELKRGERYFEKIEKNEARWIERGVDVDRAFKKRYYKNR